MKHLKRTAAFLIAVLLIFSSFSFSVLAEDGWDGKTETACTGSGNPDDPYLISTPEQLAWFRTQVNSVDQYACAKLTADIDLNNQNWTPIGNPVKTTNTSLISSGAPYRGTFDGNGHTVSGFKIDITTDSSNYRYIGFFGAAVAKKSDTTFAEIKNLTVEGNIIIDSSSKAANYVAGICGCGARLKVTNCTSDVEIKAIGTNESSGVAGIVGFCIATQPITIENCINLGDIDGNISKVGGILGSGGNADCIINLCCNLGNINGNTTVGGLIGFTAGKVTNCYSIGSVTANMEDTDTQGSGGLIGMNKSATNLNVNNCFVTGTFSSEYENYTGGVFGRMSGDNTTVLMIQNVYYLEGICSRAKGILGGQYINNQSVIELTPKTAAEVASNDFVALLNLNAGSTIFKKGTTHPIFVWQEEESAPVGTKGDIDGNGTVNATDVSELISRIANDNVPENAVADMNGDGTVNATDVSELISVIAAE